MTAPSLVPPQVRLEPQGTNQPCRECQSKPSQWLLSVRGDSSGKDTLVESYCGRHHAAALVRYESFQLALA